MMSRVFRIMGCLRAAEHGATAIEYALIAGGIAVVIVAAVTLVGTEVNEAFVAVSEGF
ncbi:Flp family type IVb pilin [Rhodospira trueperi]|uniref:Pilus assembly protein Flp/PilA n=1 Tax=Rhodospira trueperi TaxID=69960 RepID=A0A1G7DYW5_9PROT|nr:Flp family type IVb pilin [Rhodospira trueperi]SDE56624.1 pilus assembly protein Flp/PilA [Rhodospira trueperi]